MSLSPNEIPQIQPTETGGQKSLNHLQEILTVNN